VVDESTVSAMSTNRDLDFIEGMGREAEQRGVLCGPRVLAGRPDSEYMFIALLLLSSLFSGFSRNRRFYDMLQLGLQADDNLRVFQVTISGFSRVFAQMI
jgi:hypothetical protein